MHACREHEACVVPVCCSAGWSCMHAWGSGTDTVSTLSGRGSASASAVCCWPCQTAAAAAKPSIAGQASHLCALLPPTELLAPQVCFVSVCTRLAAAGAAAVALHGSNPGSESVSNVCKHRMCCLSAAWQARHWISIGNDLHERSGDRTIYPERGSFSRRSTNTVGYAFARFTRTSTRLHAQNPSLQSTAQHATQSAVHIHGSWLRC